MIKSLSLALCLVTSAAWGQTIMIPPPITATYINSFSGVDCTGATDSTTGVQAAFNSGAPALRVPANCTIVVNSVLFPAAGLALIGDDPLTSVIQHKASATGHMLYGNTQAAWTVTLQNLTFDGNYQNATGVTYASVRFYKANTDATSPSRVFVSGVRFINGENDDIDSSFSTTPQYIYYVEQGTYHLGGADSGHAEQWTGGMRATLTNVIVDHQRLPTSVTDVGHAGIVFYSGPTDAIDNYIDATNIQCNDTGISASATLGCLDVYHGAAAYTLTNSQSTNAIGRGFTWKADSQNVTLTNNIVTNLAGNPANASGNVVNAAFGANSGTIAAVGTDWTLTGNQCINSGQDCYVITARNVDTTQWAAKIVLANNMADGCASGRRGISITTGINLKISGGLITGCDVPIYMAADGGATPGPITVTDVDMRGSGKSYIDSTTQANGLWWARNRTDSGAAWSATNLKVAVTSNAITAWNPIAIVDTSGGAQTVSTINGVPDGELITLSASSASNPLTLQSGGNLVLNSTAVFTADTTSTITFRSIAGSLKEVARTNGPVISANTFTGAQTAPTFAIAGNLSAAFWSTAGLGFTGTAPTYTDTTSSGTVASISAYGFPAPTVAASSATTYTNLYGLTLPVPVAGSNVTATNSYSLKTLGGISANGLVIGFLGAQFSGANSTINNSSNFSTTINGGTSNGTATIGNSSAGATVLASVTTKLSNIASSSAAQTGTVCLGAAGLLTYDTTTTCLLSDMRDKENFSYSDIAGLKEVMAFKPLSYDVKASANPILHALGRQVGLGAQDVAKVDPRLVAIYQSGPRKGTPSSVRYEQMVAVLIKAIQEQQVEIDALKAKIK